MRFPLSRRLAINKLLGKIKGSLNALGYRCDLISREDLAQPLQVLELVDVIKAYQVHQPGKEGACQKRFLLCYRDWANISRIEAGNWNWLFLQDCSMPYRRLYINDDRGLRESLENFIDIPHINATSADSSSLLRES